MAERIVDAAVVDGPNTAMFCLTDQYVRYDFAADRVLDGVHALSEFPPGSASGFPASFAPPGPSTSIDAALAGRRRFAGFTYFFSAGSYIRVRTDPPPPVFDPGAPGPIDPWHLPAGFGSPDAGFNGALNRAAFGYLFSGPRYVRYVWDADAVDQGYPKPMSNMIGIPPAFAAGVDAAVDGAAGFTDASYLFKDDTYLRFQWVDGGAEPHGDGGTRLIRDGWLGLDALALAGKAKSTALEWIATAGGMLAGLSAGTLSPDDLVLASAALAAHFHVAPGDVRIAQIQASFAAVEGVLRASAARFRFRDPAQVSADGAGADAAAYTGPVAGTSDLRINFTNAFHRRQPINRVSSVIHEGVHVIDPVSGRPENHVSEWYVTAPTAAALGLTFVADMDTAVFATRYDLMSVDNAIHNPSSYATFARHIALRVDSREVPS